MFIYLCHPTRQFARSASVSVRSRKIKKFKGTHLILFFPFLFCHTFKTDESMYGFAHSECSYDNATTNLRSLRIKQTDGRYSEADWFARQNTCQRYVQSASCRFLAHQVRSEGIEREKHL